jgi:hypothetical protein
MMMLPNDGNMTPFEMRMSLDYREKEMESYLTVLKSNHADALSNNNTVNIYEYRKKIIRQAEMLRLFREKRLKLNR